MPRPRVIKGRQSRRTVILGEWHALVLKGLAASSTATESEIIRRLIEMEAIRAGISQIEMEAIRDDISREEFR